MPTFSNSLDSQTRGAENAPRQRVRLEVALMAGAAIKVVSVVVGWEMFVTFSIPLDPFGSVYLTVSWVVGAFLAGLIVGFLLRSRRRGALWGLVCAAVGTILVSFAAGSLLPFPPGWFVFLGYLIFDTVGLIGGVIGASASVKMLSVAVLVAVLCVASVAVSGLAFGPTKHTGDLVLEGSETMTIQGVYQQDGDVVVKDNATLVVRGAEFIMYQVNREHSIELRGSARFVFENSSFTVIGNTYHEGTVSSVYTKDDATALLNGSDVSNVDVQASDSSHVAAIGCSIQRPVTSSGRSNISISDSGLGGVVCYNFSSVSCRDSSVVWCDCNDDSQLYVDDSNLGIIDCHANSSATLKNSNADSFIADAFQGRICFDNSAINTEIGIDSLSDFYLCGNVTISGEVRDFNGQMTRSFAVASSPWKQLNVSRSGETLWTGISDSFGYASFDLVFTPMNCTDRLMINDQAFNSTSTTPLIVN